MQEQVSKSQFKAKALELFRKVESSGDAVIVTGHGIPTIEVRQYRRTDRSPLDVLKGSVTEYIEPLSLSGGNGRRWSDRAGYAYSTRTS